MKSFPGIKSIDPNTRVLIKQIFLGFLAISFVVGLMYLIWHGTRANVVTLTHVEVFGGETISHEDVRVRALEQLEGEYAGFIPKRFAYLYPKSDIVSSLSDIERIHSIAVSRIDGKSLYITFDEYIPEALWCKTLERQECLFIDENAYAYGTSPDLDGGSLVRYIHTSETPELKSRLLENADFQLLKSLVGLLQESGWYISHVEVDSARDAFLHVVDGGEFKVTLTQDPSETVDNLEVVLTSEEFADVKPGAFQYIDLRFGNKVFINNQPETVDEPEETATSSEEVAVE